MSINPPRGHYNEFGYWVRDIFCFVECENCTCKPPNGLWYSKEHDKRLAENKEVKG